MPVLKSKAYTAQQAIENALNYIEDTDKTGMLDWERFFPMLKKHPKIQSIRVPAGRLTVSRNPSAS